MYEQPKQYELEILARYPRPIAVILIIWLRFQKTYLPDLAEWVYGVVVILLTLAGVFWLDIYPYDRTVSAFLGGVFGFAVLPIAREIYATYRDADARLPVRKEKDSDHE